jgi:ribosomal 50S subunit-recycling heat shock protein
VEEGDIITIKFRNRIVKVQVEQTPQQAISKKGAGDLYAILEEIPIKEVIKRAEDLVDSLQF